MLKNLNESDIYSLSVATYAAQLFMQKAAQGLLAQPGPQLEAQTGRTPPCSPLYGLVCRYSWTLYCDWNRGIWQRNQFSHPNIAEVVLLQVTPRNGNKFDQFFQSWYWVLKLDSHSKDFYPAYWATLMLTQEESFQLYHEIKNLLESTRCL
jgi:hypothetical protein